jgi:hypothetical protein
VNARKLLIKALASPANLRFEEVCTLARAFGFHLSRISGSHHIFVHNKIHELLTFRTFEEEQNRIKLNSSLGSLKDIT